MKKEIQPFLIVSAAFIISILLVPYLGHNFHGYVGYLLFLIFFVELPLLVLMSRDVLFDLNTSEDGGKIIRRFVRTIASLPSLAFGTASLLIGLAIMVWMLYNVFIETLPSFSGITVIPSLEIGPLLVYWGYSTIKSIFGCEEPSDQYDDLDDPDDEFH